MLDSILLAGVGVGLLYGFFRGVVSQAAGLAGLILAYLFAGQLGDAFSGHLQTLLNISTFVAQKFSLLVAGMGIYLACRIVGLVLEKSIVARVKEFKRLNRWGGAGIGGLKVFIIVFVALAFLAILPQKSVQSAFPAVQSSRAYAFVRGHNPFADPKSLAGYRKMRTVVKQPGRWRKLKNEKQMHDILQSHGLDKILEKESFVEKLEKGDYGKLRENRKIEKMMQDDQLANLIDQIEREAK